jgi:hypothetical protein
MQIRITVDVCLIYGHHPISARGGSSTEQIPSCFGCQHCDAYTYASMVVNASPREATPTQKTSRRVRTCDTVLANFATRPFLCSCSRTLLFGMLLTACGPGKEIIVVCAEPDKCEEQTRLCDGSCEHTNDWSGCRTCCSEMRRRCLNCEREKTNFAGCK